MQAPAAPSSRLLGRLAGAVSALTSAAMGLSAVGVLVSLALICWSVVMRYIFHRPPVWVDDLVGFLLVGIVMLAAAHTLRQGEHIGVDVLTDRLGPRGKRWVHAWSMLAVGVVALILIVNGWETAMAARQFGIQTAGEIEVPVFWLQLLLPAGGAMLLLVVLEALLRLALGAAPIADAAHADDEPPKEVA